eukprot:TRINITY_DN18551_c0_g1_i1.p1 TRINITY_DN18551_c0_g1~~TRINITY_DN18551_c0_g1_i1.p1  ORF type:complete len:153 (-),score=38.40 TRINITY_DN18551_c0_g1_i1:106-564(-)
MHPIMNQAVITEQNAKDFSEIYPEVDKYYGEEDSDSEFFGRKVYPMTRLASTKLKEIFDPLFDDDEDEIAKLLVHLRGVVPNASGVLETPRVILKPSNINRKAPSSPLRKNKKIAPKHRKKDVRIPNACYEHKRKHQKCPLTCKNRLREQSM